jgi:hypothetical protein
MNKLPTLMIAYNDEAFKNQTFIIRTKKPRLVGQVIDFENESDTQHFIETSGVAAFAKQYKDLRLIAIVDSLADLNYEELGVSTAQEAADKLAKIARRMSDWYNNVSKR